MRRQGRRKEHAQREGWKTRHSVITGVAVSATSVLGFAQGASATNFVVNNGGDGGDGVCQDVSSGDCTLRDAVYSANDNTGYDAVTFASSISGATLSATIGVYDGVRIQGNGAAATTISGNHVGGIFLIATGNTNTNVNISDVTLTAGNKYAYNGGAISNIYSNLNIYNTVLSGNQAANGGALFEYGYFDGGASLDVVRSTFTGNTADNDGGAMSGRSLGQVIASTISGNHAGNAGGGAYTYQRSYFDDDTFAANSAQFGGGVYAYFSNAQGSYNSIFAGNTGSPGFAPDFSGNVSAEASLFQNTKFTYIYQIPGGAANITGVDPQLGPLQNNGGPDPTRLLAPTSPVIDKGDSYYSADQRGVGRPVDITTIANVPNGDGSDMGAVEMTAAELAPPSSAPPPVTPTKKKKCKKKKKKHSAAAAKKKKCKKKKKKHSAALDRTQTGGKDWPNAFKRRGLNG
jgi:hypothetical protein